MFTEGSLGCLTLLVGWTACGMLLTTGVLVVIFGTVIWGVGYILLGLFFAVASSVLAHIFSRKPSP